MIVQRWYARGDRLQLLITLSCHVAGSMLSALPSQLEIERAEQVKYYHASRARACMHRLLNSFTNM
jgi:hypothetical protein